VVALCVVFLPSLWINAKGILSEPLFCLLLLATFWVVDASEKEDDRAWLIGLLMAAMALTRTAALPMIAVYGLWALTRRGAPARRRTPDRSAGATRRPWEGRCAWRLCGRRSRARPAAPWRWTAG